MDERYDFPNPDINPDSCPSRAITKQIVAQLDGRAEQRKGRSER